MNIINTKSLYVYIYIWHIDFFEFIFIITYYIYFKCLVAVDVHEVQVKTLLIVLFLVNKYQNMTS